LSLLIFATDSLGQDLKPAVDAAKAAENEGPQNILDLIFKGGWIMIPLGICSVLALAIAVERFISLTRKKLIPPQFLEGLRETLIGNKSKRDYGEAREYCETMPCPISNIFMAGINRADHGDEAMEKAIEDAGAREVDRMKRSLRPLAVIARIAPLLGLLGTVYGMISAFQSASGGEVNKADTLAVGIYEALVTTATGLTLAIPVLIVHQILSNRVDSIVDHIDDNAIEFLEYAASPAPVKVEAKGDAS
jgi:biopolymer transport protein ExbB